MRIKDDTKEDMIFMDGDLEIKKDWEVLQGLLNLENHPLSLLPSPKTGA